MGGRSARSGRRVICLRAAGYIAAPHPEVAAAALQRLPTRQPRCVDQARRRCGWGLFRGCGDIRTTARPLSTFTDHRMQSYDRPLSAFRKHAPTHRGLFLWHVVAQHRRIDDVPVFCFMLFFRCQSRWDMCWAAGVRSSALNVAARPKPAVARSLACGRSGLA
jgi:hypothetical protein